MKITNRITAIMLVLLCALGWFVQIESTKKKHDTLVQNLEDARNLRDKHLYQMAVTSYKAALSCKENDSVRSEMLECMLQSVEDGTTTQKDYIKELKESCTIDPQNVTYWELLIGAYVDENNYAEAHNELRKAEHAEITSQKLDELRIYVNYSNYIGSTVYEEYIASPYGFTAVKRSVGWGSLLANGEEGKDCIYSYVSPFNREGTAIYVLGETRLIDTKGVVRAILPMQIEEARAFSDGCLPVKIDGRWALYHCDTGEIGNSYESVSAVVDGMVAIRQNGEWSLVNIQTGGTEAMPLEDIKLLPNGEYCYGGVMVAKRNGAYGLYSNKGELIAETDAVDMEPCWGDWIAWKSKDGKWGFVDQKGEVTIAPQYDEARSFSGGLAAVKIGDLWGFIDKEGIVVIRCEFKDAGYFTEKGVCMVSFYQGSYQLLIRRYP